jgi:predicted ArsR family transcriptional regulator
VTVVTMPVDAWPDAPRETALAVSSRRRLVEVLRSAPGPRDAEELAAAVGLHVTTVRHHLRTLVRAGLVRRAVERAGRPGRPRLRYTATADSVAPEGYRELAAVLSAAFAEDPDGGRHRAEEAGQRWADRYVPAAVDASAEEVIGAVQRSFDLLGFAPRHRPVGAGYRFLLDACPFRDVARAHPEVVCSVHLGLLRGALRRLGCAAAESELRPFVEPELCVADVRLPGRRPPA